MRDLADASLRPPLAAFVRSDSTPTSKLAKWGYPAAADDDAFEDDMRPYVRAPGTFGVDAFDVVLIDGRYRNACAYAVIPFLRDDSIVAWHDWDDASWRRLLELEDALNEL